MPDTSTWLVATKLHPPLLRSDTIRRPDLEGALSHSVTTLPLTLLSAPAGYGKSTLLAALPHLLPDLPLAWVTLDPDDNDPIRFISLLTAALQRLHPDCGPSVWPRLAGGAIETAALKQAMGALINDILAHLPAPFILVLDDLHFVTEPAVHIALEYLLDHLPPQLHLAIGTRHDPPLRLARLAARRQLAELRRPDLSFTADQAHALLNETLGLSLTASEVAALQERTEGWPAGLCLLAGPLARLGTPADRTQFMTAISQTERYALDFLADEVLHALPPDLRRFLLESSVLSELTPAACQAVTGRADAAELLERLYRQNLAIASITPGAAGEPVYRYHALLTRLLARQLERELPGELPELRRRAAEAQPTPGRAIAHYLAAGLYQPAAALMIQSGMQLLHRGMAETIRQWYGALPADIRSSHPRLAVLVGRCEIHCGDYPAAGRLLHQAREAFIASGDSAGEGDALASLITLTIQNDDAPARAELSQRALQLPLSPLGQVAALLARAWGHLERSDWDACRLDIAAALAVPQATGNRQADLIGITYMSAPLAAVPGCLALTERYCAEAGALAPPETAWRLGAEELGAWPLLWRGRTDEALARAEAAEALRQRLGGYPFVGNDLPVVLSVLQIARGDMDGAAQSLATLMQRTLGAPRAKWPFYLHAAGRGYALLGRQAEAQACHRRLAALPDGPPLTRYLTDHLAGLIHLTAGRLNDAAAPLARAAALEASLPIARVGGSARLLQGRLLLMQGRPEEGFAIISPLLQGWEQAGTPGFALLDGPAGQPAARAGAHPESLTERERDVLKGIVAGQTNRQIGEALFITEETVKTHVARILRKLEVSTRTQAAIRGRELGI